MLKSDEHMSRIKRRLLVETKAMKVVEQRKSAKKYVLLDVTGPRPRGPAHSLGGYRVPTREPGCRECSAPARSSRT